MPLTTGIPALDEAIIDASFRMWDRFRRFMGDHAKQNCAFDANTYNDYFLNIATHTARTKTVLYCFEPVLIEDFYVPLSFSVSRDERVVASFENISSISEKCVLLGTGGSGKSTVLRVLFQQCLYNKSHLSPFFVDLRNYVGVEDDFSDFIIKSLVLVDQNLKSRLTTDSVFRYAKSGAMALFLDGFDEIAPSFRKKFVQILQTFTTQCPSCTILLTSRDTGDLRGLEGFVICEMCKLSFDDAVNIVRKTSDRAVPAETKKDFLSALTLQQFEHAAGFADNPLLLSLMLLTFGQRPDAKPWHFDYPSQVFDVMLARHDAFKAAYERKTYSGLERSALLRLFEAMCALGFLDGKIEWHESQIHELLERSSKVCEVSALSSNVIKDLVESLCLLIRDGDRIRFIHRYIQEYFAASYLIKADSEMLSMNSTYICKTALSDGVVRAMWRASPTRVKKDLFAKYLDDLADCLDIRSCSTMQARAKLVEWYINRIETNSDSSYKMGLKTNLIHLDAIYQMMSEAQVVSRAFDAHYNMGMKTLLKSGGAVENEAGEVSVDGAWLLERPEIAEKVALLDFTLLAAQSLFEWRFGRPL